MDELAEIVLFARSGDVSFANYGLPYYLGSVIEAEIVEFTIPNASIFPCCHTCLRFS
jgi:hypothetical protein